MIVKKGYFAVAVSLTVLDGLIAVYYDSAVWTAWSSDIWARALLMMLAALEITSLEGTVLNIVNWGCNVIAPVIAVACLGIAGWHFKSGRGYMGWGVSGVALMVISGLGRMAEGFITQAQGIQ